MPSPGRQASAIEGLLLVVWGLARARAGCAFGERDLRKASTDVTTGQTPGLHGSPGGHRPAAIGLDDGQRAKGPVAAVRVTDEAASSSSVSAPSTVATGSPVTATSSRRRWSGRRPARGRCGRRSRPAPRAWPRRRRWSQPPLERRGRSGRGRRAARTPATILAAPWYSRRNDRQPADVGSPIPPGTRKASRPSSSAHEAVINAPLRAGASTTTVASDMPAMTRFRRGKVPGVASTSGASSRPPPRRTGRSAPRDACVRAGTAGRARCR